MGDNLDKKKKLGVVYFFMRNLCMTFQNINIHGSKLQRAIIFNQVISSSAQISIPI